MESTPETTTPPTFVERLNIIISFVWMLMNIGLFVTAIIFKRNSYMIDLSYLNFDKLTVTLICIVGAFVLLYSLFFGFVYLITGNLLNPMSEKTKALTQLGLFFGFSTYVFLIIFKVFGLPREDPIWFDNFNFWIIRHWYLLLIPFSLLTYMVLVENNVLSYVPPFSERGTTSAKIVSIIWLLCSVFLGGAIIFFGFYAAIAWPFIMVIKYLVT